MEDGAKSFSVILTAVVAGIGPVLLMTVGLVANGVANLIKMFQLLGGIFRKTGVDTGILGTQTDYMTQQQIEAAAVAASLNQSHSRLTQTFSVEAAALNSLTAAYQRAITAQRGFGAGGAVPTTSTKPKKYAKGVISVPGPKGKGDVVPAMLSPGEAVIPAKMAKKYGGLINAMISGKIPGYEDGNGVKGYTNFGAYIRESQNKAGNKSATSTGIDRAELIADLRLGKEKMMSPIIAELATQMGATTPAEITAMLDDSKTGPKLREFGRTAATGLADSLANGVGRVDDTELYDRADKSIKSAASKVFGATGKAQIQNIIDSPTTFTDTSQARVVGSSKSSTGLSRVDKDMGRKGVGKHSYLSSERKNMYGAVASHPMTQGTLPPGKVVFGHLTDSVKTTANQLIQTANKMGASVSTASQAALQRIKDGVIKIRGTIINATDYSANLVRQIYTETGATVVDKSTKGIADGAKAQAKIASPSRVTRKIGQDTAQGYIDGVQSGAGEARKAGRTTGRRVTKATGGPIVVEQTGTQMLPTATRKPRRAQRPQGSPGPVMYSPEVMYGPEQDPNKKPKKPGIISRTAKAIGPMGGMMAAGAIGGGVSMIPGLQGLGAAISIVGPLMMMLPGPIGIAVGAITALGLGVFAVIDNLNKANTAGVALARSMSATQDKIQAVSEVTGTVSATESRRLQTEALVSGNKIEPGGENFGKGFLESDAGKGLLADIATQKTSGVGDMAKNLAAQLSTYVAQGVMTSDQAQSIAIQLGTELKDYKLSTDIRANLTSIIGPNGENLEKDPLRVTAAITAINNDTAKSAMEAANTKQQNPVTPTVVGGAAVGAAGAAAAGMVATAAAASAGVSLFSAAGATALATGWTGVGLIAAGAIAVAGIAVAVADWTTIQAKNTKLVAQAVAAYSSAYEQNAGMVDVINQQYDKKLEQKEADLELATSESERLGILKEISTIEGDRATALDIQAQSQQELLDSMIAQKGTMDEGMYQSALRETAAQRYEDNPMLKAAADQALTDVSNIDTTDTVGSGRFSREVVNEDATRFQTILEMQVASGILDPTTTQALLAAAGTTEGLMTSYNVAVSTLGDQKTAELLQLANASGADGTTIDVLLQATAANPESFDGYVGALSSMRDIQAAGGLTIDINSGDGQAALEAAADTITALKAEEGEITLDVIQRVTGDDDIARAIANNADFQAMDKDQQISYVANYDAIMSLQGNEAMQAGFEQYLLNHKGATFSDYAAFLSGNAVTTGGGTGGSGKPENVLGTRPSGGGGGGPKEDSELAKYNKQLDKQQKALTVISLKEDKINKKFDERKKALEDIQKINQSISEQQKDQLDTAIALTSGDIASAARAVQAQRAKAAAFAQEEQMRALEKQRQDELDNVSANGTNRSALEDSIAELQAKVAQREYELSGTQRSGGGGGGGGGYKPAKPPDKPGWKYVWNDEIYGWEAIAVTPEATAGTTLTSGAPVAPDVSRLNTEDASAALDSFNARLTEWASKNKIITDGVVSTLGLTAEELKLFGTNTGLSVSDLKQKIIDMGGTVDETGNVSINGFKTTLENLATGIGSAAGKAGVPWEGIFRNLQELKDKAKTASGPVLTVAQQLWKATRAAGGSSTGPYPVATGGMISSRGVLYRAAGGGIPDFSAVGTDTVPAMLTPGEYVVSRPAVQNFGVKNLQAINSGKSLEGSSSVYNYSVTVNAGSNASADDIARTVIGKIKQVENTRFKGNRF
jgi:hypothetical protein